MKTSNKKHCVGKKNRQKEKNRRVLYRLSYSFHPNLRKIQLYSVTSKKFPGFVGSKNKIFLKKGFENEETLKNAFFNYVLL